MRHFVPIGKILKPVINECVTPVTCYWSLALIARDEAELILVFKVRFLAQLQVRIIVLVKDAIWLGLPESGVLSSTYLVNRRTQA